MKQEVARESLMLELQQLFFEQIALPKSNKSWKHLRSSGYGTMFENKNVTIWYYLTVLTAPVVAAHEQFRWDIQADNQMCHSNQMNETLKNQN